MSFRAFFGKKFGFLANLGAKFGFKAKFFAIFVLFAALLVAFVGAVFWHFDEKQGLEMSHLQGLPKLKVLDIVLRAGIDLDSLLISQISGSPYSHIGVVISTQPLQILHASSSDTQNRVAVSEFEYFLAYAKGIAVKRYRYFAEFEGFESANLQGFSQNSRQNGEFESVNLRNLEQSGEAQNPKQQAFERVVAYLKSQIGKEFRLFSENDKLYCTTLIENALKQAFEPNLAYEKLDLSLLSGEYLFPKAFYDSNQSVLIYEFLP